MAVAEASAEQLAELPFYNNFFRCSNQPAAELAARLSQVTPERFQHVFFTNSGSEANDTQIKLVHRYFDLLGKPEKKLIISRQNADHGSTIAASTLGGMSAMHKQTMGLDYVHHIQQPHWFEEGADLDPEAFGIAAARELEKKIDELGEDRVAAFIAEPVQGAGGVIVPPPGYHRRTREVCDRYEVIYISEEVVTGFGRLGQFFASEDVFDFVPDIITCAKGISSGYVPLSATILSKKIYDVISVPQAEGALFTHGFTYSGHPISCAAGLKNIEIMEREDIFEHVRQITPYFQQRLRDLARHPIVGDARGMGLLGCIEGRAPSESAEDARLAVDLEFGTRLDRKCEARGLLVRPIINMAVFSPPLIIQQDDIDRMFDIMDAALAEVGDEML